jgi:hypothetical protein
MTVVAAPQAANQILGSTTAGSAAVVPVISPKKPEVRLRLESPQI